MTMTPAVYGFVGAGEITAAIVAGLSAGVTDPPAVFLSPRGREVGHQLAASFANVRVCDSNQDVLDAATTVVLAVRPRAAPGVLDELRFRPRHVVISAVAGLRLARLRALAAPAGGVVRVIPLPQAARRNSLTAMYPDVAAARGLFDRVGDVVVADNEGALESLSAATATFAAHLDYLVTIVNWLTDHGVDPVVARTYVTRIFGQLGQSLLADTDSLAALSEKHSTPGGINDQVMADLRNSGVPEAVRRALDAILARNS